MFDETRVTGPSAEPSSLGDAASVYLDAWRALASNLVVVSHILLIWYPGQFAYKGGSLAVVVFFLLSGFLISQSMIKAVSRPGPRLPRYLADRVARIMTPFVPVLLIVAMVEALLVQGEWGGRGLGSGVAALLGNLFMLQDHPVFQLLEQARVDVWWRIRPYRTGEPFWTVAIEFWLYAAVGLAFFGVVLGEKIRRGAMALLCVVALPVFVWNAAAGFGESLTLVWLFGAVAGAAIVALQRWERSRRADTTASGPMPDSASRGPAPCREGAGNAAMAASRHSSRWWLRLSVAITGVALLALAGRAKKDGFDPHSLQIAVLVGLAVFGVLVGLLGVRRAVPTRIASPVRWLASYSYSLYLIHNTVLIVVFEHTSALPKPLAIALGVLLAQLAAWGIYMAFERHYRQVGAWLRPLFARYLAPAGSGAARYGGRHLSTRGEQAGSHDSTLVPPRPMGAP